MNVDSNDHSLLKMSKSIKIVIGDVKKGIKTTDYFAKGNEKVYICRDENRGHRTRS
jgi:hypothetical protein